MQKNLTKVDSNVYYFKDGVRVSGVNDRISGNVSEISGNVSGIYGNVSGISGNLDDCEITEEERKEGIDINDLIKRDEKSNKWNRRISGLPDDSPVRVLGGGGDEINEGEQSRGLGKTLVFPSLDSKVRWW